MYHIKPESIKAFLDDDTIRLPRFQRKQTWKDEQNFKLVISVFKDFPLGVTIINKATYNRKTTRWLLDGRQRRYALMQMSTNPENLYEWGKRFIKIKSNDSESDIRDKFWNVVEAYLNNGDDDGFNEARVKAIEKGEDEFQFGGKTYKIDSIEEEAVDDMSEGFEDENDDDSEIQSTSLRSEYHQDLWGNLENLLFVLKTVHKKTSQKSGFTSPFDFKRHIERLPYVEDNSLCGKKLKTFIDEYLNHCRESAGESETQGEVTEHSLFEFYGKRFNDARNNQELRNDIKRKWSDIKKSIKVVQIIKEQLQDARIGVIETSSITSTDAQMIFMLINKEGTKLSAVEILSAKPSWNVYIKQPSSEVEEQRNLLYSAINTSVEQTVRWDYPATIYQRLKMDFLFPNLSYENKSQLDKKLTLGFKILSGLFQRGIKAENVDDLASNRDIKWEQDIDQLVADLNTMSKVIGESSYFKRLTSLGRSLMEITSDACALNFLFLTHADFLRKNKPVGNNVNTATFTANATKLADQMLFEYVTFKWRGSSDSKVANNIQSMDSLPVKYKAIARDKWIELVKGINNTQTIEGEDITIGLCKSIVYHTYAVMGISSPSVNSYDIDHIMPQALFDTSDSVTSDRVKHALFNLCPLPAKENKRKGKKKLSDLDDRWLIDNIKLFALIEEEEFSKFSKVSNWKKLREKRGKIYEVDFMDKRQLLFDGE